LWPLGNAAAGQVDGADESRRELKEGRVLHAVRIRGAAPSIDGVLDDEVWARAERASGLIQRDPDNGKAMMEDTYGQAEQVVIQP
jgi:hypothetical protein